MIADTQKYKRGRGRPLATRNGRQRTRQRRRRGRFGGLYQLLSFLVVFAAILVGCVVFFRVNVITVSGNAFYSDAEVIAASGVKEGDNLFLISRPKTAGAIVSKLPYIESVSPIKRLPDRVELRVTETRALCAIQSGGDWWLLNDGGKLLDRGDETVKGDLPSVLGLDPVEPTLGTWMAVDISQQTKLEGLKSLLTELEERGMTEGVTGFIDLHATNVIYFGYGEDLTVAVPMSGDFERRILSLQRVVETFAERGERLTGTLDLTYGDDQARLLTERWLPQSMRPSEPESTPESTVEPTAEPEPSGEPQSGNEG